MAYLFDIWTLMFWIPSIASAAMGWYAAEHGLLARPVATALWFLAAFALQWNSAPLSLAWTVGMVAQTALAIYLGIRAKLDA